MMAGSACARISSCGASSVSSSRPNLPSNNRTVLPMREGYPSPRSIGEPARPFCRDYSGIYADPVKAAEQPAMLDLDAPVHDRFQAGGPRLDRRGFVLHPELLPQDLRADGDGVVGDWHNVIT